MIRLHAKIRSRRKPKPLRIQWHFRGEDLPPGTYQVKVADVITSDDGRRLDVIFEEVER